MKLLQLFHFNVVNAVETIEVGETIQGRKSFPKLIFCLIYVISFFCTKKKLENPFYHSDCVTFTNGAFWYHQANFPQWSELKTCIRI